MGGYFSISRPGELPQLGRSLTQQESELFRGSLTMFSEHSRPRTNLTNTEGMHIEWLDLNRSAGTLQTTYLVYLWHQIYGLTI